MKPKEMNTRFKFKELNDPLKEKKKKNLVIQLKPTMWRTYEGCPWALAK